MNQMLNDISADLAAIKYQEEELVKTGQPFQFAPWNRTVPQKKS